MGTLNAALGWAQRGFLVFPLREGSKQPVHDRWHDFATKDPDQIRALWTDPVLRQEHNYNIGTLCTDMVVVDIDVKKGKDGLNEYASNGGHYDTLVVRTPTGGFHCYFNGPDSSNSPLSGSVDIRSHNGYVLAPGSRLPGYGSETYEVYRDLPVAYIPRSISTQLKSPYARQTTEVEAYETPAAIHNAIEYLRCAPPAIEGNRGDDTTFIVAARLIRELGLSMTTAFNLMMEHYNPRCMPPWDPETLLDKIENAHEYGTAEQNRLTPEVLFAGIRIPPVPSIIGTSFGNAMSPGRISPRPWIVDRMLISKAVTLLLAAGSAGKSSISLTLAAHLALGKDFAGFKTHKACKTVVYNGEDDTEEQSRRLLALCKSYGLDFERVKESIMILSSRDIDMTLVKMEGRNPVRNQVLYQHLSRILSSEDVGLFIIDPLVKVHQCEESDNVQMDVVMGTLTDLAHDNNISVLTLHHTSKSGRQEERVGNMDISRGASAIVNASRVSYTLLGPTAQDAEAYGFDEAQRNQYTRLDDAKMNLTQASDRATWFHKEGVLIESGDMVGVLKFTPLEKSKEHIRNLTARVLYNAMRDSNASTLAIPTCSAYLKASGGTWPQTSEADIRRRLEEYLAQPVIIDGAPIQFIRHKGKDGKGKEQLLVSMNGTLPDA